ncbi:MAG TPA: quinone oxidoreductase [Polyangiaceae bacterium]|nr:quinone oxidoreductase [Polyangiaceae bacterium]
MRAIRVHRKGGPEVLQLEEMPTPRPGAGEALVRVEAAGVNYMDVYTRTGAYGGEMPLTLGAEGAGVVEAVGEGVTDLRAGQRVAWASVPGSYATHVVARADKLVPVPDGVSTRDAAAAMLQGMTAHYLAHATFPLKRGDACLVHAAAGGVGLLLVQMAKRAGARVFGTVSTEEKARLAREAGLDEVVFYTREAFDEVVRARTGGRGLDVVYDSVGATTFDKSLLCLRPRGMMVLYGQSSGRVPPFDLQVLNARGSLFVTRPTLRDYTATRAELLERAGDVLGGIARGELKLRIDRIVPLDEAADAHRALESRETSGKVLLLA